jgi:hypothetical protein
MIDDDLRHRPKPLGPRESGTSHPSFPITSPEATPASNLEYTIMNLDTGSKLDSAPARFSLKKKLHINKEALRTLTGSEKLQIVPQGRTMVAACHTFSF